MYNELLPGDIMLIAINDSATISWTVVNVSRDKKLNTVDLRLVKIDDTGKCTIETVNVNDHETISMIGSGYTVLRGEEIVHTPHARYVK